jgi:hypothetical protein
MTGAREVAGLLFVVGMGLMEKSIGPLLQSECVFGICLAMRRRQVGCRFPIVHQRLKNASVNGHY